jgi:hypothetical protein
VVVLNNRIRYPMLPFKKPATGFILLSLLFLGHACVSRKPIVPIAYSYTNF